jgi:copper chaperone
MQMVYFEVPDMFSCRSMGAISKSVKAIDHEATIIIDMVHHSVAIESGWVPEEALERAIGEAGFTPIARRHDTVAVDLYLPLGEDA